MVGTILLPKPKAIYTVLGYYQWIILLLSTAFKIQNSSILLDLIVFPLHGVNDLFQIRFYLKWWSVISKVMDHLLNDRRSNIEFNPNKIQFYTNQKWWFMIINDNYSNCTMHCMKHRVHRTAEVHYGPIMTPSMISL